MARFLNVVVLLVGSFVFGYQALISNSDENYILRDPAAVRNSFDFSTLQGEKLISAIKQRVVSGIEFRKNSTTTSIGLGHFLFADSMGQKKAGCDEFDKVALQFEAEGVSVAGEKPEMEIEGYCVIGRDNGHIDPLILPVAKILGERPADGEFQFNEGSAVTVLFANLPDEWPKKWLLKSVVLINKKTSQSFRIESEDVANYLGHPMVLTF